VLNFIYFVIIYIIRLMVEIFVIHRTTIFSYQNISFYAVILGILREEGQISVFSVNKSGLIQNFIKFMLEFNTTLTNPPSLSNPLKEFFSELHELAEQFPIAHSII